MKKKINVGILFGGKSAEHEVSLQSAKNVYDALDRDKYNPVLIGIDKQGRWHLPPQGEEVSQMLLNAADPRRISLNGSSDLAALVPESGGRVSNMTSPGKDMVIDVVFPILHGPLGEDGTVQGLLKLANIPFVGAGVLGSAVGMDKEVMKRLLRDAGLPIGKFRAQRSHQAVPDFKALTADLGFPFFVKPANMGSSVGVSKVSNEAEYLPALRAAFEYDTKAIIEEFIPGRELECSVLGNEDPAASLPGEVRARHEFYSYDAKYLDDQGAVLEIPAKIPEDKVRELQSLAIRTFEALNCEGLARVDFFMKEGGELIINEINTIPGFTRISMYPKLWEASGLSYPVLIDTLIRLGISRFEKEKKLKTSVV
jgi:D-alanine-D-alanine ligase